MLPGSSTGILELFRTMLADTDGAPLCGGEHCMLGPRVPQDVRPDGSGYVKPDKGISVAPDDPARLPIHLRPKRLGGQSVLPVFRILEPQLGVNLAYRPSKRSPSTHGEVCPSAVMALAHYRAALGATRLLWKEV